jgi:hypothetical protein
VAGVGDRGGLLGDERALAVAEVAQALAEIPDVLAVGGAGGVGRVLAPGLGLELARGQIVERLRAREREPLRRAGLLACRRGPERVGGAAELAEGGLDIGACGVGLGAGGR